MSLGREVVDRSTEETRSVRFYTYSLASGKRQIPDEWSTNEHNAIMYASVMFASGLPDNVTREEGPPSKPTSITIVWERNPLIKWGAAAPHVVVVMLSNFDPTLFLPDFVATGANADEALDRLMDAWRAYADTYHLDPDLVHLEDARMMSGPLGSAFVDGQPL